MFKRKSHVIKGSTCEYMCTCVCGLVCAAETRREDRTRQTCSTGERMSYLRSHVELEFVSLCVCSHTCVQMHTYVPAHYRSRDRQSGRQGTRVSLHFCRGERSFVTKIGQDCLGIDAGRLAKWEHNTSGTHGWWLFCSRQSALFEGEMTCFCNFQVTGF